MGFINQNFLGGAEREAGRLQASALGRGQDFIREGTTGAQGELQGGPPVTALAFDINVEVHQAEPAGE